jgi:glycosyltransferase involved in cell wall biosynthesis
VSARPLGVLWEGSFFVHHSLAVVNCEVAVRLAARDGIDLGLVPYEPHRFDASVDPRFRMIEERLHRRPSRVDFHVRHRWPPDFSPPAAGAYVLVQPWEFSWLPVAWVEGVERGVDDVWTHTTFVRDAYLRSGVRPEKVALIPLGVDAERFRPGAEAFPVRTEKSFRFLFIGGAIERKGFDVLLRAYVEEFAAHDDVCLVVKDFFYGRGADALVRELRRDPAAPEVRYGYGTLPPPRLPGLFAACDCYVHPYRAEGFGLPIVEAMAAGLPVIVTGHGAALDFCSESTAYLVPARETPVPADIWPDSLPTVRPPVWVEPNRAELRRLMRHVVEHRAEARARGAAAREHVRRHFTWERTVDAIVHRLEQRREPA